MKENNNFIRNKQEMDKSTNKKGEKERKEIHMHMYENKKKRKSIYKLNKNFN